MQQDADDPTCFTLYERWREPSVEAFVSNQFGKEYRQAYEARLPTMLRTPRSTTVLRHVEEWRRTS
jgi:quinol monooxygenase YgiN